MKKATALLALLVFSQIAFSQCLTPEQISTLNQIGNATNMTNQSIQTLIGIFEMLCQRDNLINSTINATREEILNTILQDKNQTNATIRNLSLQIANLSHRIDLVDASVGTQFNDLFAIWKNDTMEDVNRTIQQYELTVDRRFEKFREDYAKIQDLQNLSTRLEAMQTNLEYEIDLIGKKASNYGVYGILFTLIVAVILYWQISQLRKTPKYSKVQQREIEDLIADRNVQAQVSFIKQLKNLVMSLKIPIEKKLLLFKAIDAGEITSKDEILKLAETDTYKVKKVVKSGKKGHSTGSRRKNKKGD